MRLVLTRLYHVQSTRPRYRARLSSPRSLLSVTVEPSRRSNKLGYVCPNGQAIEWQGGGCIGIQTPTFARSILITGIETVTDKQL
jgi:hypothetical protein